MALRQFVLQQQTAPCRLCKGVRREDDVEGRWLLVQSVEPHLHEDFETVEGGGAGARDRTSSSPSH